MTLSTNEEIVAALGGLDKWAKQCHSASLAIVNAGLDLPGARVARGSCRGIQAQHSWVTLGSPYEPDVEIVDPTFWSYQEDFSPQVIRGSAAGFGDAYWPHGKGNIWEYGCPTVGEGEIIVPDGLSEEAIVFLDIISGRGLDRQAWALLLTSPVQGWPSKNIVECACSDPRLSPLIPIDIVGMVTDLNPDGLYLRDGTDDPEQSENPSQDP